MKTATMKIAVIQGAAEIVQDGLRCRAPRGGDNDRPCNKLLVKLNSFGQVAGRFRCDRCKGEIEVVLQLQE